MANPLINSTRVIIPVEEAIRKTTNWRNFMAENFSTTDTKMLPKAVYISRSDIEDMAAYCNADDSLLGVRAYFTLDNQYEENISNQVKFIMVLVKDTPGYVNGEDLMYIPEGSGMLALSPDNADYNQSNVFDFTRPCPDSCDLSSPLFSDENAAKFLEENV